MGWEAIGLSSFLLIAFYRTRYLPVKNGLKVLSIYRVSDVALILVMWMMHHLTHQNISFSQLTEAKLLATEANHQGMAIFIVSMIVLAAVQTIATRRLPTRYVPVIVQTTNAIFLSCLFLKNSKTKNASRGTSTKSESKIFMQSVYQVYRQVFFSCMSNMIRFHLLGIFYQFDDIFNFVKLLGNRFVGLK